MNVGIKVGIFLKTEIMEERLKKSLDALEKHLENMSEEEKEEMRKYFEDKTPKGWVSIEEHLPNCTVDDLLGKGYSEYIVKDKDGNEFVSAVCDHNIWYYHAKEIGITHWFNK